MFRTAMHTCFLILLLLYNRYNVELFEKRTWTEAWEKQKFTTIRQYEKFKQKGHKILYS